MNLELFNNNNWHVLGYNYCAVENDPKLKRPTKKKK